MVCQVVNDVVALVLNWRAGKSTISCIDSIFKGVSVPAVVVVIDNNSRDKSVDEIRRWCLKQGIETSTSDDFKGDNQSTPQVVILQAQENKGYAGGNNIGIEYARKYLSPKYLWIVNNDARPHDDALKELLVVAKENDGSFVSSVTLFKDGLIEAYGGGHYYPIIGKAKLLHKNKKYSPNMPVTVNYLMGASLLVPSRIIDDVGLMDECFFMYSEEIDWQWRAMQSGYGIVVARKSLVYHEGASSSETYQYHFYRNRAAIMFNSIYFGCVYSIISAVLLSIYTVLRYVLQPKNIFYGVKGCFSGACKKRGDKMSPLLIK